MKVQRVAYVLNIFPKLSETFIAGELAELRRRGVELRILSLLPPRQELQHDIIRRAGLDQLVEYDPARFAESVKAFRPNLLHAHFAKEATEQARTLSAQTGVPFTFTAHGYDIQRKPPADFRERAIAARAVVTVSRANANYIRETFNVPDEHIHVIPCGVDTEKFRPTDSVQSPPPLILCVARHVAVKNLGLLLDACAVLRDRGVSFGCVMIGDGPLRAVLEAKRDHWNLGGLVELPGAAKQGEVLRWWQQATVGVLTSDNEGMPVCLMEAAACGVPVVATRVGGLPELVADGVTGILAPPGDARAFATALELVLVDHALRRQMSLAARQRAVERFSVARQTDSLLDLWGRILTEGTACHSVRASLSTSDDGAHGVMRPAANRVSDPFGAAADRDLPTLEAALNFEIARSKFQRRLPRLSGQDGKLGLKAVRVTRHKPGRRCVVEYDVRIRRPGAPDEKVILIGKVRARRSGNEGYRLQDEIWNAGFEAQSADGISVPEPIGVISDFQMWFQRKIAGRTAEQMISRKRNNANVALARRVAEAIHKLHGAGVPAEKQHTLADELRILRECFDKVAALRPAWTARLAGLMAACERLGANAPAVKACGIHRDFYAAQVIVDGARLWLIDFDLYCLGDPGLDVGNFLGHVTEQALRERGDANALAHVEHALEERFVELAGEGVRASVRAYATLTLARHIYLSTTFPERQRLTEQLLELCEARVRRQASSSPDSRAPASWTAVGEG